jgi:phosphatidylglycerol---prolipoprotein diacylglyceryl transferase
LIAYLYWDVRPELIQFGGLAVRWYGLLFALVFWLGYAIVQWEFRREGKDEASLGSLLTHLVVGTLVGARLGHCLFYEPAYYLSRPLEILKIWEGGLASHGGGFGVLLALYLYTRKHPDQSYLWLLDRIAVPAALAGSLIRLGNLFNSEILGMPTDVPWAVIFARVDQTPRHPVQMYESLTYAVIFVVLIVVYRNSAQGRTPGGLLLGLFLVSVFTARFFIEFVKERQSEFTAPLALSVGQWLSIPFVVVGLTLLWRTLRRHPQADLV